MKIWQIWVGVGIVALSAAWMLRYDVRPVENASVVVMDRWLGTVSGCSSGDCVRLFPPR